MANMNLTECMHPDCEVVEARRYNSGTLESLSPMLYSGEARSFYCLGSPAFVSYSIMGCDIEEQTSPGETGETFSCNGNVLQFSTAAYRSASAQQASALDAVHGPGRYSY